uniref:Uncharacterized protein n=1 Tax=Oryza glumipatula TaxID=40148 RepID=A0A0D9Y6S4_9ORYZ
METTCRAGFFEPPPCADRSTATQPGRKGNRRKERRKGKRRRKRKEEGKMERIGDFAQMSPCFLKIMHILLCIGRKYTINPQHWAICLSGLHNLQISPKIIFSHKRDHRTQDFDPQLCIPEALSKKKKKKHMKNASPRISMDTRIKKLAMRPIIGNVSFRQQNSLAVNHELNGINELEVEKNST